MNEPKFFDLNDELNFGKYNMTGKIVEEVLEEDPGYIRWCIENITDICFSGDVEQKLNIEEE